MSVSDGKFLRSGRSRGKVRENEKWMKLNGQGKVREIEKERVKSGKSQGILTGFPDSKILPLLRFKLTISVSANGYVNE